jgi:hypothetical protein
MERHLETPKEINKQAVYQAEFDKLSDLFKDVDESKQKLASGLIEDAAYLYAENTVLRALLSETGMIRINPDNSMMQKPVEAAKQYRSNVDTYSTVIGKLSRILDSQEPEENDDMEEYT